MEKNIKDRRRFQRVIIKDIEGELKSLMGLKVKLEGDYEAEVFDLSHSGMAVATPDGYKGEKEKLYSIEIAFPSEQLIKVSAVLKWFSDKVLGFHFEPLSLESRQCIGKYLEDKVIGVQLNLIEEKYYAENMDCDYWYQGPYGTNIYIWTVNMNIEKAQVVLDRQILSFEDGKITVGQVDEDDPGPYNRDDWVQVASEIDPRDVKQRAIDVLSQVEDGQNPLLKKLLSHLIEASTG